MMMNLTENKNVVETYLKICKNIKDYKFEEFEEEYKIYQEVFNKQLVCPIAFTEISNDNGEFTIQVNLELENNRIVKIIEPSNFFGKLDISNLKFTHYEYETFNDWEEIEEYTKTMRFEELIILDADINDITDYLYKTYA